MQVRGPHAHQLGDAHPRGIQHLDQGAVAQAERRADVGLREKDVHFLERQELRKCGPGARRLKVAGGAGRQAAIEHQEPVIPTNGRDRSGDRARRQPACDLLADERLERVTIERRGLQPEAGCVPPERSQIAPVTLEGMRGQPAFHA